MPKQPCRECGYIQTCLHDDRCEHGILTNRVTCEHGCAGYEPTEEDIRYIEHAKALNTFRTSQLHTCPLPLPVPNDQKVQRSFRLSEKAYQGLLKTAYDLGYVHDSSRKPNPTQFLEALGQNLLHVFYD